MGGTMPRNVSPGPYGSGVIADTRTTFRQRSHTPFFHVLPLSALLCLLSDLTTRGDTMRAAGTARTARILVGIATFWVTLTTSPAQAQDSMPARSIAFQST